MIKGRNTAQYIFPANLPKIPFLKTPRNPAVLISHPFGIQSVEELRSSPVSPVPDSTFGKTGLYIRVPEADLRSGWTKTH